MTPLDGQDAVATLCEACVTEVGYETQDTECSRCDEDSLCMEIELAGTAMMVCSICSHELREEFPDEYGDDDPTRDFLDEETDRIGGVPLDPDNDPADEEENPNDF